MNRKKKKAQRERDMERDREEVEEMQSYACIMKHLLAYFRPMVLKCTVQLGLADIINNHGRAMMLSEIAAALPYESVHEDRLYRILRYLVHMRLLAADTAADGKQLYRLTSASKFLLKDGEKSIAPMVLAVTSNEVQTMYHCLSAWVDGKVTVSAYELRHGCTVWEMITQEPDLVRVFNDGLAAETRAVMPAVVKDGRGAFQGIGSLVDVGGGIGMAAGFIVKAFPRIKCTVLDLPVVVAQAPECPGVTLFSGDMFSFVPPADAVFMKNVLHDWGDEDCIKILKRCKEAIPRERGKVIIVEIIMGIEDMFSKWRLAMDMSMAVGHGSKERTKEEWEKLLQTVGFNVLRITHTSCGLSIIEACPN